VSPASGTRTGYLLCGAYKMGVSPYHQTMKQIRIKFYMEGAAHSVGESNKELLMNMVCHKTVFPWGPNALLDPRLSCRNSGGGGGY
jgi:hypothetical protein